MKALKILMLLTVAFTASADTKSKFASLDSDRGPANSLPRNLEPAPAPVDADFPLKPCIDPTKGITDEAPFLPAEACHHCLTATN